MRVRTFQAACWCVLAVLMFAGTACNKSDENAKSSATTAAPADATNHRKTDDTDKRASQANFETTGAPAQEVPAPPATTPAEAVTNFLEAVRRGDDGQAEALLSTMARKKTREMDLAVAPPGSSTARFEIGGTDYPSGAQSAHVSSMWSDVDGAGHERTDEIVWILRKEDGNWRIAGMATKLFEDQPPLILNFEDPQDMVSKQRAAEEEIRRRATGTPDRTPTAPVGQN